MYGEMVTKFHDTKSFDTDMLQLREKLGTLSSELRKTRNAIAEKERLVDNMQRDMERVARGPDLELRHSINALVDKYIKGVKVRPHAGAPTASGDAAASSAATAVAATSSGTLPTVGGASARGGPSASASLPRVPGPAISVHEHEETVGEIARQREYMRRGAAALGKQSDSVARLATRKAAVAISENLHLMEEGNMLRQEVVFQRRRLNHLETEAALRASVMKSMLGGASPALMGSTGGSASPTAAGAGGDDADGDVDVTPMRRLRHATPTSRASLPTLPRRPVGSAGDDGSAAAGAGGGTGAGASRTASAGVSGWATDGADSAPGGVTGSAPTTVASRSLTVSKSALQLAAPAFRSPEEMPVAGRGLGGGR